MTTIRTVSFKTQITARPQTVFAAVTQWEQQPLWMMSTTIVAEATPNRPGKVITATTGLFGRGLRDPMSISEWRPNELCKVQHLGKIIKGDGEFIVTKLSDTESTFEWVEHVVVPFGWFGRLYWPVIRLVTKSLMRMSLMRLKQLVENGSLPK